MAIPTVVQLFVASPSDATRERELIELSVHQVNAELARHGGPEFKLVGFDEVRGTVQRPQEAINALIASCDYMIVVFRDAWGSDPGGPLAFTSGTEEELFVGLLALQREDHPMRDLWLAFAGRDSEASEIRELREQIKENHAWYYESPESEPDFRSKLLSTLKTWAELPPKRVRTAALIPRSGRDILGADRLRAEGEVLVKMGLIGPGISRLQDAAKRGGPSESIALARVLGRRGEYPEAIAQCDQVVQHLTSSENAIRFEVLAEVYAYQADLLRRAGNIGDAVGKLELALQQVQDGDAYPSSIRCRILDNLGLARQSLADFDGAHRDFQEARGIRRQHSDTQGEAQSEINLSRLAVARRDLDSADRHSSNAIELLEGVATGPLHPNAYLARAQVLLRLDDHDGAGVFAERALVLNRQFGNRVAEAKSLNVFAQAKDKSGNREAAEDLAGECVALNAQLGIRRVPYNLRHLIAESPDGSSTN